MKKKVSGNKKRREHEPRRKAIFVMECFLATILCLLIYLLLKTPISYVFEKIEMLSPFSNKIEDFELSDMAFATRKGLLTSDSNVVIVDCSRFDRNQIAEKLMEVDSYDPKVIGLDLRFIKDYDSSKNDCLVRIITDIINSKNNIVLAADYEEGEPEELWQIPFYRQLSKSVDGNNTINIGYNETKDETETLREFQPYFKRKDGEIDTSFDIMVIKNVFTAQSFQGSKISEEKNRIINFWKMRQNLSRYLVDWPDSDEHIDFRNKIVLLGLYDSAIVEDKHYTPLNGSFGRSVPDMSGVEYHAQVISMIVNNDFISDIPYKNGFIFFFCFLFMMLFKCIHNRQPILYHYFIDGILILTLFLSIFISSWILLAFETKFEPVEFIAPIFSCGLLLHFHEWLAEKTRLDNLIIKLKGKSINDELQVEQA